MLICDTHADTLWALQDPERDRGLPLHITKERLQSGQDVRVQALALFTGPSGLKGDPDLVRRELRELSKLKEAGWRQIFHIQEALPEAPNILLTVEGGEVFHGGLEAVEAYAALGVRMAALVWNHENLLAYPAVSGSVQGLTAYGKEVVRRMHALGMAVDISHLNPAGVESLLALGGPAYMASHSCAYALCAHPRNLTDDQLRTLFAVGGFVGINFYPRFLHSSGVATLDTVIDHIAYLCDLGGETCVGLGSDFDGIAQCPRGLAHGGEIPALLERMRQRGFGERLVRAIAGENFAAYLASITRAAKEGPFVLPK